MYMAGNIGANDVANAMGTSVGSKALTFKQAVLIAGVAEFAGAFLVGGHVSDTIRKGMLDPGIFQDTPLHLVFGMIAALLAAGVWLNIATYLGWPVSTTHSIVGAVVGFGIIAGGWEALNWGQLGKIVLSWVVSPVMGALVAYFLFRILTRLIFNTRNPLMHTKEILPYLVFLVFVLLSQSMVYKGLKNLHLDLQFSQAAMISLAVGFIAFWVAKILVPENTDHRGEDLQTQFLGTEAIFRYLQIITAFYVAFAHGSNDVANAVGPLAAVVAILDNGTVYMKVEMPLWILGLGGGCIVLGLLIWGAKVMKTVGEKITEMTPSRGFCAEFAAATVVLVCSKLGLPISTTHTLVGSIIGVGLARGLPALDVGIIKTIFISWVATLPFTAVLAMIFYKVLLVSFS
ncbi:MAG: inorganic phosphate transporter [Nitrospinae bacterium]|nr:inorganic phosphate transporter [Nitrospinota bacterium]